MRGGRKKMRKRMRRKRKRIKSGNNGRREAKMGENCKKKEICALSLPSH